MAALASIACAYNIVVTSNFGLFNPRFPLGLGCLFNALAVALFCLVLVFGMARGKGGVAVPARRALTLGLWVLMIACIGLILSYYWTPDKYSKEIVLTADVVEILLFVFIYFKRRRRFSDSVSDNSIRKSASGSGAVRYAFSMLYGALIVMMLVTVVYFIITLKRGGDFFVLAPFAAAMLALVLWRLSGWRGFLLAAFSFILVNGIVYMYGTWMSYGFDSIDEVMSFTLLYMSMLLPFGDLYCRKEAAIW